MNSIWSISKNRLCARGGFQGETQSPLSPEVWENLTVDFGPES